MSRFSGAIANTSALWSVILRSSVRRIELNNDGRRIPITSFTTIQDCFNRAGAKGSVVSLLVPRDANKLDRGREMRELIAFSSHLNSYSIFSFPVLMFLPFSFVPPFLAFGMAWRLTTFVRLRSCTETVSSPLSLAQRGIMSRTPVRMRGMRELRLFFKNSYIRAKT